MKIKKYFDDKRDFFEKKKLLKYFDKSNVRKYYIKKKCKYFSFNIFNNFLYNKKI